jgi:hypothetical protein
LGDDALFRHLSDTCRPLSVSNLDGRTAKLFREAVTAQHARASSTDGCGGKWHVAAGLPACTIMRTLLAIPQRLRLARF